MKYLLGVILTMALLFIVGCSKANETGDGSTNSVNTNILFVTDNVTATN